MITGRFTYGLGQVDSSSVYSAFQPSQSTVLQTAPAEWGAGEWMTVAIAGYVAFSVLSTTRRTVGRTRGYLAGRRERLASKHEARADYYRSKKGSR